LIFLVGMDVGIEKESDGLVAFLFQPFERIDATVSAADVEKEFHYYFVRGKALGVRG